MSATSVGEIGLDLVVNQNQFNSQMNSIASTAKKAGAVLAAAFSVKAIVNFGKECLELGSDLAEVQNVVDVTFSTMSSKVDEFAKGALTTYGLSETMAKQYTGTFGAMAKAFGFTEDQAYDMSTALTGLAGDVASFYNISQDEAYTKLKSVFSGETETLKDLGVVMTQNALDAYAMANGFGKTTSQMTEAEKVMLRYQFVSEQLAAAQGDFSRTSGSWANQVRILKLQFDSLKASIGQGLINLFTPIIRVINSLIGKLATLANAFKSFTELLTGQKSSGTGSTVSSLGDTAETASTGMDDASSSADNLADSNDSVADSAKKASKAMRSLMGFDQINKLSDTSEDSSDTSSPSGSSGSSGSGGALGSAVDFGNLAEGETVLDKTGSAFDALIKRARELAAIFKKGFKIGFGDSEKKIDSIRKSLDGIGTSLKEIFTDPEVTAAANDFAETLSLSLGKTGGSLVRIGLTCADNFYDGVNKYLAANKSFIKSRIVDIFDASSDIANLAGNYFVACADIFDVFSSEEAKQITADIIEVFANGFLGVKTLTANFIRDLVNIFVTPVIENVEKIKETLNNMLVRWQIVFDTIAQSVTTTFEKILEVYNEHLKPFFDSVAEGLSEIVSVFLDAYNEYISPVMDYLADKFSAVWEQHIQPALNGILELLGEVFDFLTVLWDNALKPLVEWIIQTIMPVLAPIIKTLGSIALNIIGAIGDAITGITKVLKTVISFIKGVFTADWRNAWTTIKNIFSNVFSGLANIAKTPINAIISAFNGVLSVVNGLISRLNSISFKITVPDWVPGIGGSWWGFNGFGIPSIGTIPYLAQGAYVKANTPQLAMIGDNRHQGEYVAPEDKLRQMAIDAAKEARGTGGIGKDELESMINRAVMRIVAALSEMGFYMDSKQIATAIQNASQTLDKRFNAVEVV